MHAVNALLELLDAVDRDVEASLELLSQTLDVLRLEAPESLGREPALAAGGIGAAGDAARDLVVEALEERDYALDAVHVAQRDRLLRVQLLVLVAREEAVDPARLGVRDRKSVV